MNLFQYLGPVSPSVWYLGTYGIDRHVYRAAILSLIRPCYLSAFCMSQPLFCQLMLAAAGTDRLPSPQSTPPFQGKIGGRITGVQGSPTISHMVHALIG